MSKENSEQIRRRLSEDEAVFFDAFASLSEVVAGRRMTDLFSDRKKTAAVRALSEILRYFGIRGNTEAFAPEDPETYLDQVLRAEGITRRWVELDGTWYRTAFNAFLAFTADGTPVALLPGPRGYTFADPSTGKKVVVSAKTASQLSGEALCLYMPLPRRRLQPADLIRCAAGSFRLFDLLRAALCTLAVTGVSMLLPFITRHIYSDLIRQTSWTPLLAVFIVLICVVCARFLMETARMAALSGLNTRLDARVNSAMMARVLSLPVKATKDYPVGTLYAMVSSVSDMASRLIETAFSLVMTVVLSIVCFSQIMYFTPALILPAVSVMLILFLYSLCVAFVTDRVAKRKIEYAKKEDGFLYAMITGMRKIRLAGAEKRVFARWADLFVKRADLTYNPPFIIKYNSVITDAVTLLGSGLIFYSAYTAGLSAAEYLTFMSVYGMLLASFSGLTESAAVISTVSPTLKLVRPLLDAVPESAEGQRQARALTGRISVSGVSFRYSEHQRAVLKDISLEIRPGEYIAVVGKSGCGKSTLLKLLLGFEKPTEGSVSYDNTDITMFDPTSLRRRIGCVMQNEKLFTGTIRANITVSAPDASDDDVWAAARMAGIEDDIRKMPMGLNTFVSDGASAISGGQKQRVNIARAIVSKPDILLLDEATSALDNYTQKIVSDSLAALHCTRVVVAHRLSTVKECDRIIVIDDGRVAEEGTYDSLMALNGRFADLVRRQQTCPTE